MHLPSGSGCKGPEEVIDDRRFVPVWRQFRRCDGCHLRLNAFGTRCQDLRLYPRSVGRRPCLVQLRPGLLRTAAVEIGPNHLQNLDLRRAQARPLRCRERAECESPVALAEARQLLRGQLRAQACDLPIILRLVVSADIRQFAVFEAEHNGRSKVVHCVGQPIEAVDRGRIRRPYRDSIVEIRIDGAVESPPVMVFRSRGFLWSE